ncbi:MAG: 3-hydroxyacyl-CoA dehydrogenase family protein [Planctomycetota bacterium]|jgi:3-hydroxyacyl-CoA dehydrogenase
MIDSIKNVVILGSSGTIGSLTGGLFAQMGIKVFFLSRTLEGAKLGLQRAVAQARSEVISRYIECGDYNCLERALEEADFIIESVCEDLETKRKMYQMVEKYRKPGTIVGTTTSSLSLTALVEECSEGFKNHFLSTHFYNPPGKMQACEIARIDNTLDEVYNFMEDFLKSKLHKQVVPVNNIPGFAGNRIAFLLFNRITTLAKEYGVEMMDYLIGPYTGRLMPPLATIDLVGVDIYKAIIQNLYENSNDEMHNFLILPDYVEKMVNEGILGNKTKCGFYKKLESGKYVFLDPETFNYIPAIKPYAGFIEKAKDLIHLGMYHEAFDVIKTAHCKEADVVVDILCIYISYSFARIGEVTKLEYSIDGINNVMLFGFHWAGPTLIIDMLGGKEYVMKLLDKRGFEIPQALKDEAGSAYQISNVGKYFIAK